MKWLSENGYQSHRGEHRREGRKPQMCPVRATRIDLSAFSRGVICWKESECLKPIDGPGFFRNVLNLRHTTESTRVLRAVKVLSRPLTCNYVGERRRRRSARGASGRYETLCHGPPSWNPCLASPMRTWPDRQNSDDGDARADRWLLIPPHPWSAEPGDPVGKNEIDTRQIAVTR